MTSRLILKLANSYNQMDIGLCSIGETIVKEYFWLEFENKQTQIVSLCNPNKLKEFFELITLEPYFNNLKIEVEPYCE